MVLGLLEEYTCSNLLSSVLMGLLWSPFARLRLQENQLNFRFAATTRLQLTSHQREPHHHPIPLPEDLMQKVGGGYGFTMIDLANAYAGSQKS